MIKNITKNWVSILFNVAEIIILFGIALSLGLCLRTIIIIMVSWTIVRNVIGVGLHYKAWYLCGIWTIAIFVSLFVVARLDFVLSLILTLFAALILSGRANLCDTFLFKPSGQTRYRKEIDTVQAILKDSNHPMYNTLLAHEKLILYEGEQYMHEVYTHIFKNGLTLNETARLMDIETTYVSRAGNLVQWGLKTLLK